MQRRSRTAGAFGTTLKALLIGGGVVGIGYGAYIMARRSMGDQKDVIRKLISPRVEQVEHQGLADVIVRTHYTEMGTLTTEKERHEAVIAILSLTSIRCIAAPISLSVTTVLATAIEGSLEAIARLGYQRISIRTRNEITASLNEVYVSAGVFDLISERCMERLQEYAATNLLELVSPQAFLSVLKGNVIDRSLYEAIIKRLQDQLLKKLLSLSKDSVAYLVFATTLEAFGITEFLEDDVTHPNKFAAWPGPSLDVIQQLTQTCFQDVEEEVRTLIPTSAGLHFAYYSKPLLSIQYDRLLHPISEDILRFCVESVRARLAGTGEV
ncbi:GiMOMP35 [Giardia muris]|uniref:GiMOMP35 n=1 Tax=Giardia muris TaxID=5742 RepID=A0A4Z1SVF2_GIAMU|nr:GiMOMP35 [Giardia muris]|eukprot:TNJ29776.1 GiMOMP35 [Giardia muris]